MYTRQNATQSLPVPSRWGIDAEIAGKPIVRGTITINSISGNSFTGTANFRGDPILSREHGMKMQNQSASIHLMLRLLVN